MSLGRPAAAPLQARAARAEATLRLPRLAVVLLGGAFAVLLVPTPGSAALLAAGAAYAIGLAAFQPHLRWPVRSAAVTSAGDVAFALALVAATGGTASGLHLFWYASIMGIAYRFGPVVSLAAGLVNVAVYLRLVLPTDDASLLAIRVAIAVGVAGVGSVFAGRSLKALTASIDVALSEARFRGLLEAAPDAMIISDRTGRIVLVNSQAERLFGYSRGELVGRPADVLLADRPDAGVGRLSDATPRGRPPPADLAGRRRDGTEFPMDVRLSPLETEDEHLVTAVVRDTTERRRVEEERRLAAERVAEIERLKSLAAVRTRILNTASHELNTPLTPLRLQVYLLKSDQLGPLTEKQRKAIGVVDRNVERLARLVQDILDVARVDGGRLRVERRRVDLSQVVREAVEAFEEPARHAQVRLDVSLGEGLAVDADAGRLTQVVFNLVSNALKFTPAGGRIEVSTRRRPEGVLIRVEDTGIGLTAEQRGRLFQPFAQVHDPSQTGHTGTGLGLYICKGIVEEHGGEVAVESDGPGRGTTFTVTLPPASARGEAPSPARPPARQDAIARRMRDLI